jgi:flagellar biosynthesis/type III secretory pathway protein FliH
MVSRGGCRVESDLGFVDAGIDAQFDQLVHALLGEPRGATVTEGDGNLFADSIS